MVPLWRILSYRYFNVTFQWIVIQIIMQHIHCGELILPSENLAKMVSGGERLDLLGTPLSLVQLRNYLWKIRTNCDFQLYQIVQRNLLSLQDFDSSLTCKKKQFYKKLRISQLTISKYVTVKIKSLRWKHFEFCSPRYMWFPVW